MQQGSESKRSFPVGINMNSYQDWTKGKYIYPNVGNNLSYVVLGLSGEAGEIANKAKKIIRDHGGEMSEEMRESLADEYGDALFYLAAGASELGLTLSEIAVRNIAKLERREEAGTLGGAGDKR